MFQHWKPWSCGKVDPPLSWIFQGTKLLNFVHQTLIIQLWWKVHHGPWPVRVFTDRYGTLKKSTVGKYLSPKWSKWSPLLGRVLKIIQSAKTTPLLPWFVRVWYWTSMLISVKLIYSCSLHKSIHDKGCFPEKNEEWASGANTIFNCGSSSAVPCFPWLLHIITLHLTRITTPTEGAQSHLRPLGSQGQHVLATMNCSQKNTAKNHPINLTNPNGMCMEVIGLVLLSLDPLDQGPGWKWPVPWARNLSEPGRMIRVPLRQRAMEKWTKLSYAFFCQQVRPNKPNFFEFPKKSGAWLFCWGHAPKLVQVH